MPGILLVEDNAEIRASLREVLELEGMTVDEAGDGAQALARLRGGPAPSLLLLDLMMPVMDGWDVLEALRGSGPDARPDLPVVVVSGVGEAFSVGARYGCEVLQKPVDIGRLLDAVRRHAAA